MKFKTTYQDEKGSIETYIINENNVLSMNLDGVVFKGSSPASFVIESQGGFEHNEEESFRFKLTDEDGFLTNCRLSIHLPVKILINDKESLAHLKVDMGFLYKPGVSETELATDQIWSEFTLISDGFQVNTRRKRYQFDDGLLELKEMLPSGCTLKCCWNCKYSGYADEQDYFGSLRCYKNHGVEFFDISTTSDFFDIEEDYESEVQEIHVCEQFISR